MSRLLPVFLAFMLLLPAARSLAATGADGERAAAMDAAMEKARADIAASTRSDPAVNLWYNAVEEAKMAVFSACKTYSKDRARSDEYRAKALSKFDEAVTLAPDVEYAADAMYHKALAYETFVDRPNVLATYRQLLIVYPTSGHVPAVCARLGELHSAITMLPGNASQADEDAVNEEFASGYALTYYEQALATARPNTSPALAAKIMLVQLYWDAGRRDQTWKLLYELADMSLDDVREADYVGPYVSIHDSPISDSSRIDALRARVLRLKEILPDRMVSFCIGRDPRITLANLRNLAARYPGTDIAAAANKKIENPPAAPPFPTE